MKRTAHPLTTAITALALAFALAACAPRANDTAITSVPTSSHWYPHDVGTFWTYVPEGETNPDNDPYRYFVRGPSVFRGAPVTLYRLSGRGNEINYHRSITDEGVFLHHEERVGATLTYDPPIKELPPIHQMTPGLKWSTDSTVTVTAAGENTTYPIEYQYEIHENQTLNTPIGNIKAYRITQTIIIDPTGDTDPITRTQHYAPHVGYVTNHLGLTLTNTNAHAITESTEP